MLSRNWAGVSLLTLILATVAAQARAAFIYVISTPPQLSGSFDANGFGSNLFVKDTASNGLMPGDATTQLLQTIVIASEDRAFLLTPFDGSPDDPEVNCSGIIGSCGSLTGSYTNAPIGKTVDFAFPNLVFDGTRFTGDFSFTVSEVPLPAAAWLFGSALMGLVALGKARART